MTDGRGDPARLVGLVAEVVAGGVRAVQLREPGMTARQLADLCRDLRPALQAVDGLLIVNDRADLVAAGLADGVHLGGRSLSPVDARRFLAEESLVGCSAHDPDELLAAAVGGADYASLSPILPTSCKPGAEGIGVERAASWTRAADLPVIWLGGLQAGNLEGVRDLGAAGFGMRSALCDADEPGEYARAVREILSGGDQR